MSEGNFSDFITRERDRLSTERDTISTQRRDLDTKLTEVDREIAAIEAYESAKTGKTVSTASRGRTQQTGRAARRGSKREALLQVIRDNPNGLRRGEIIQHLGLKGDKSGEMSISNALTALVKGNQVKRSDGKYLTV